MTWMQKYGAILAVANIRGGGEFGEEWHLAGTRERKVGNQPRSHVGSVVLTGYT